MAELGLTKYTTVAVQTGEAMLPAYRTRISKRRLLQPPLLAILGLTGSGDWTSRGAEVYLEDHRARGLALRLQHAPDYTTSYRFLQRLSQVILGQTLSAVV